MSTYVFKSVYTEVEVEIDIDDVIDFLTSATEKEIDQVKAAIKYQIGFDDGYNDMIISADNLYDREKILIFKKAMNKYNIDQLLERLDIKQNEV